MAQYVAQEPPRLENHPLHGARYEVDILDLHGELVCTVYASTSAAAWNRALMFERRARRAEA